ncbi:hypothetical protein [Serratia silvae]|uniref:Uncharacterized protein n=1 Tax=Serratia silvae TaxID=2824122 RepID=A0ABT0K6Z5_9GAMM|nr:hypothetical protein [Serratia silvae]MCL1027722.1 hypothetical protein [Serratia silvae]
MERGLTLYGQLHAAPVLPTTDSATLLPRMGEFLHPFEYAKRFPRVATAFALVRQSATPLAKHLYTALNLPRYRHDAKGQARFVSFNAEVEQHINTQDLPALCQLLATRLGELARRLDHLLRMETQQGSSDVQALFCSKLPLLATPMLLTLASSLSHRDQRWPVRVYFPKGAEFLAPATADNRMPLPPEVTLPLVAAIEQELLQRFARQPDFQTAVIDETLRDIMVPFNERTSSSLAIDLPRGSLLSVPSGCLIRLFTHWCQPPQGYSTDLDLAVAFFDMRYSIHVPLNTNSSFPVRLARLCLWFWMWRKAVFSGWMPAIRVDSPTTMSPIRKRHCNVSAPMS